MKINKLVRKSTIRTVEAELTDEDGNTETVRVNYFSPSVKAFRERHQSGHIPRSVETNDKGDPVIQEELLAVQLSQLLHSSDDIVDENDKPVKLTYEFLVNISIENLISLYTAVMGDISPKLKSVLSSTTSTATDEAKPENSPATSQSSN